MLDFSEAYRLVMCVKIIVIGYFSPDSMTFFFFLMMYILAQERINDTIQYAYIFYVLTK